MGDAERRPVVLVIDDDADIVESLQMMLEDEGFDVATAANGNDALEYLRGADVPSIVLLDLVMPEMDGYEFRCRQLADASLRGTPVIVITADRRAETDRLGGAFVLRKPFDVGTLVDMICAATRHIPALSDTFPAGVDGLARKRSQA
jgi:CheY-like chemotaxis protein